MRLNADYVRDILLYIESNLNYDEFSNTHKEINHGKLLRDDYFVNYDKQELTYALELLIKSGFIDFTDRPSLKSACPLNQSFCLLFEYIRYSTNTLLFEDNASAIYNKNYHLLKVTIIIIVFVGQASTSCP